MGWSERARRQITTLFKSARKNALGLTKTEILKSKKALIHRKHQEENIAVIAVEYVGFKLDLR